MSGYTFSQMAASGKGLTVLSNMGNFIISLHDLQSNITYVEYAMKYYKDLLPDKDQATVISARYTDINTALKKFGGEIFSTSGNEYLTKTSCDSNSNYTIYLSGSKGGGLSYNERGLIRGVKTF